MSKRVMIGMSGGVDSSVAAYLLKKQGYEVIGVTMKLWQDDEEYDLIENDGGCCSLEAVEDARAVADKLGIPFYVLNFKEVFKEKVIDYFIDEYLQGRTPNPCIACNKHIKFDDLYRRAMALGCDYVATGHYAKIEKDEETGRYLLTKSVTDKKDQTYALYNLTQEQLEHTLLPIGDYEKERVREIAKEMGILTIGVVTKPFAFEGRVRMKNATEGIKNLQENVDTLITVPNDKLLQIVSQNTSMMDAFSMADNVLKQGIQSISDLIKMPGLINLDFADVSSIMKDKGLAYIGIGSAQGENRAIKAAQEAIQSPLLETAITGAKGILLNIASGGDLTLFEVNDASNLVTELCDPEANIIFGTSVREDLGDEVLLTVIATDF